MTVSVPEGARLIALSMTLNGTPRHEAARYLQENFDLGNTDAILDEVYGPVDYIPLPSGQMQLCLEP